MKKNWVKWIIVSLVLLGFYSGSYCVMSVTGRYEAEFYGIQFDESGQAKFAPKKLTKGPSWYPFEVYTKEGNLTSTAIFYFPMLMLDRLFWHNDSYVDLETKQTEQGVAADS